MINHKRHATFVAVVLGIAVLAWVTHSLVPPVIFKQDGSWIWDKSMNVVGKTSILPAYPTRYYVSWSAISYGVTFKSYTDYFVKLELYNGYGILDVSVDGVLDQWPQKVGLGITTDWGGRYRMIVLRPSVTESNFRVKVTDKFGNITEVVLRVPLNPHLKSDQV